MRAQFFRGDDEVGSALWTGDDIEVEATDDSIREALERVFHRSPVVVDDPALRSYGTSGPTVLQPGPLRWFTAAARARGEAEGFLVRFLPEAPGAMGWDPAGTYRRFSDAIERIESLTVFRSTAAAAEAGGTRSQGERGPSEPGTEAAKPGPAPSAAGATGAG